MIAEREFVTIEKPGDRYHGQQGTIEMIYCATEAMQRNGKPWDWLYIKLKESGKVLRVPSYFVPAYDPNAH